MYLTFSVVLPFLYPVEDVNLALSTNRIEPIYGLHLSEALHDPLGNLEAKAGKVDGMIALGELSCCPSPHLHSASFFSRAEHAVFSDF